MCSSLSLSQLLLLLFNVLQHLDLNTISSLSFSMTSHYKADENKKYTEWVDFSQENRLVIKAIALDVTWGRDSRYWTLPSDPEQPLQLHQVAWLEVSYRIPMKKIPLKVGGRYKVEFGVSMKPESAFGWSGCPVYLLAKFGSNRNVWKAADLSLLTKNRRGAETTLIPSDATPLIFVSQDERFANSDAELNLGLFEVWKGRWKGGLNIHKVIITRID